MQHILKNNKNRQKGITLIALVVTIIILLILASISVATLNGDNSILYFAQTVTEITNSPFIHIHGWTLARIIFGYSFFHKSPKSKEKKISILSTVRGWGWGGSKAIVTLPSDFYTPNEECFFEKENKNIEYIN